MDVATPFFSVIIPTYNRSALVEKAVKSVLSQAFGDLELIVVDDGSTDGTKESLSATFRDERIRVLHGPNEG